MTDNDLMPFGKHKGVKMANVPDSYLIYIYENDMIGKFERVKKYIEENWDILKK